MTSTARSGVRSRSKTSRDAPGGPGCRPQRPILQQRAVQGAGPVPVVSDDCDVSVDVQVNPRQVVGFPVNPTEGCGFLGIENSASLSRAVARRRGSHSLITGGVRLRLPGIFYLRHEWQWDWLRPNSPRQRGCRWGCVRAPGCHLGSELWLRKCVGRPVNPRVATLRAGPGGFCSRSVRNGRESPEPCSTESVRQGVCALGLLFSARRSVWRRAFWC